MKNPQPVARNYPSLINDIERGSIKIPQFQREFVWELKKSVELMDSIVKGYPIGTFIFWKTRERLRSLRDIGGLSLPEPPEGDFVELVLDGQQRITSLFATLKGLKIKREGAKIDDFGEIYLDLSANEDERIVIWDITGKKHEDIIKLKTLLYGGLTELTAYPPHYHALIQEYKKRIESYNFPIILIEEKTIDVATEIFTRINVSGTELTLFEIMVAKTFDPTRDFDLSDKFSELVDELRNVNYETISEANILHLIALVLKKECKRKIILQLGKKEFIDSWEAAIDSIRSAIDYFRSYYRIPVSRLLPYNALVVPFAYFFYKHPDKPTGNKQKYLEDFFWRSALSSRYSSSVEAKLAQDIKRIDLILDEKLPTYDWGIDTSPEFIENNGWFSVGRSYVKAILCIYAYNEPKSFIDDARVNLSNDWLKQANSRNYHHFFPKAYLQKMGKSEDEANNVLNITIVDDYLNKRKIGAKPPSEYMKEFKGKNIRINETLKTHLISDLDHFGIWDDDYKIFLRARAIEVGKELDKRLIKQDIDKQPQPTFDDDYEEEEVE